MSIDLESEELGEGSIRLLHYTIKDNDTQLKAPGGKLFVRIPSHICKDEEHKRALISNSRGEIVMTLLAPVINHVLKGEPNSYSNDDQN